MDWIDSLDKKLEGAPNWILTAGLIVAGIVAWVTALFANPTTKAVVLAWMVAP